MPQITQLSSGKAGIQTLVSWHQSWHVLFLGYAAFWGMHIDMCSGEAEDMIAGRNLKERGRQAGLGQNS